MSNARPAVRLYLNTSRWRPAAAALALSLVAAGCGAGPAPSGGETETQGTTRVVATTTVLADLVAQVGGDLVTVTPLVPLGGEVHTFDPSTSDAVSISQADLVVMNGLGLDEWLRDLAQNAGTAEVPIVELAEDLDGVEYLQPAEHAEDEHEDGEDEGEDDGGHAAETANPHLWLNVAYTQQYVRKLAETLKQVDPDNAAGYDANAAAYLQRLVDLETWVRDRMTTVPDENRRVVSFHEAFPYFAAAYGLEIVGTIIDAPGQDPSAGQIAALIEGIRGEGVSAIFAESQFPSSLTQTIADETGVAVVTDLYNDSLGAPPVDSYVGLIKWNVERIVAALQ
ncbi:MAG: metal ABC transporter substrate-binding protein [Chloroflexota bacterium]|nr:metal ABC transporter substrate-binding protein [Chloroflexota bacterium]